MAVRNKTIVDGSHHKKSSSKLKKKIMMVPDPQKNWRHKNGVWYYVKDNEMAVHKGGYHSKFLLPAVRKRKLSREKTIKDKNKKKRI